MRRAATAVSALLVAAVFAAVLVGVARRYLLGAPLVWIDELTVVLFIWCIFWTAALVVPAREHVSFELVYDALPPAARRWVALAGCAAAALCFLAALPKTWEFVTFLWRERTPALQWRLDYVYACFALFIAASGLRFGARALRLLTRRWRESL